MTSRVLVVPGTSLVGIEILRSLEALPGFVVQGAGTDISGGWDAGFAQYDYLPRVDDTSFQGRLVELVRRDNIDFVYPANDLAIGVLSRLRFGDARRVSHPEATLAIAGSKIATHELFVLDGLVPARFTTELGDITFPLFSKPDVGHSSIGATVVQDAAALRALVDSTDDFWSTHLVTECLVDDEVTVDCFSTRDQGLLYAAARARDATENGVSVVTSDFRDSGELEGIARTINSRLVFNGPWFFQAKKGTDGRFRLLEIGARLAGASRIRRAQGVNLAQLAVLAADDIPVQVYRTRFSFVSRSGAEGQELSCDESFSGLYVDLDDTLILNEVPHKQVVELVEHVRGMGGHVAVITRHRADPNATLRRFDLNGLFDEVHHIEDGAPKASFIPGDRNSVLIDDSFSERSACSSNPNILAVDASCASLLKGLFNNVD